MEQRSGDRFRVSREPDARWGWTRESPDGHVVARSSGGFASKEEATLDAIRMDPDLPIVYEEPPHRQPKDPSGGGGS